VSEVTWRLKCVCVCVCVCVFGSVRDRKGDLLASRGKRMYRLSISLILMLLKER